MRQCNNRWFQLVASLIAMIMIANLQYAWTLFVKPLQAGTGWKLSDIQFAFTLFILFQTWVQPLDGWLIDRLGPRGFISAAGLLCGLGWAGLGYADVAADAVRALLRGRHRRRVRLQRLDRIGAEVVQGASAGWPPASWRRDSAAARRCSFRSSQSTIATRGYQTAFIATGIFQGLVIVVVAQFLRHPPASAGDRAGRDRRRRLATRPAAVHHAGDAAHAAVLRDVRDVRADGDRRAAGDGQRRTDRQVVGLTAAALTLAATLSPLANGASRIFWGWASDRIGRETAMIIAFAAAGALPAAGRRASGSSPAAGSRSRWCSSTSPGARSTRCSRPRRPTTSAPARHVELRRALHREGRGVDHRRLGSARCSTSGPAAGRPASTAAR